MPDPPRVAIIGASGIGRHHANWHDAVGSQVVAFVGTTPERCHETTKLLEQTFGYQGKSYTSVDEMLQRARPDIVDICSPNFTHYHAASRALDAGCHVLCEKPLVWDDNLSAQQMIDQAMHLKRLAGRSGRHFGMCSQLVALLPQYDQLLPGTETPRHFQALMETSGTPRRSGREVWVDMGSHPISLVIARYPSARLDPATVKVHFEEREAKVAFDIIANDDRCTCEITVSDLSGPPLRRCFGFDHHCVDLSGKPGEDGYYRAVLDGAGGETVGPDPMHLLIQQFTRVVAGDEQKPLVSAETALQNLQIQLEVAGHD